MLYHQDQLLTTLSIVPSLAFEFVAFWIYQYQFSLEGYMQQRRVLNNAHCQINEHI